MIVTLENGEEGCYFAQCLELLDAINENFKQASILVKEFNEVELKVVIYKGEMKMEERATKNSWKNSPINIKKAISISEIAPDLSLEFSVEQYNQLQKGLIPEAMEDKWFIYFENDWLFFHRSWTGHCIYQAHILKEKGDQEDREYKIKEFLVERDKEIYNNDDDMLDLNNFLMLIFRGLLGIDIRGILAKNIDENSALQLWSLFGRMFFSEE